MKLAATPRALLLACFALSPLLAGAAGGGCNSRVSIGGNDRTQPEPGGPCGPTHCGPGLVCCNASCGVCTEPGGQCTAIACADACAPQAASAVGACDPHRGYRWTGTGCESVGGCSCEGADCDSLYATIEECQAAHSNCNHPGNECRAIDEAIVNRIQEAAACAEDRDCRAITVGCSRLSEDCSRMYYTSVDFDESSIAELEQQLNACMTGDAGMGCPPCELRAPIAACNSGRCGPPSGPEPCSAEEQALEQYVSSNRACSSDADCQIVEVCGTSAAQSCAGVAFVNTSVDEAVVNSLRAAIWECRDMTSCEVCTIGIGAPSCVDGVCASGNLGVCPPHATSCSEPCHAMTARAYDPVRGCLASEPEVVGCTSDTSGTDDIVCIQRESDGAIFLGSSSSMFLKPGNGWQRCGEGAAVGPGLPNCE